MSASENHQPDVCIVGAGPVGASLACLLAARGVSVAVVDRHPLPPMEHPDFDGRAYAIAVGTRRDLLEPAGIWTHLPQEAGPIEGIRVSDGRLSRPASSLFLHFDAQEAGTGPFGYMVEARDLRLALNATLHAQANITVHAPATATRGADGADGRATITLGDGSTNGSRTLRPRLLVAAEGRASPLREQAGIRTTRLAYRQSALVAAVAHERPHGQEALEHFLPAGPFAQLPMAASGDEPHLSAIVWTDTPERTRRLLAAPDAVFAHEIRRRLGDHLGALRPVGRRWHYELSAMHAERYTAPRLALVGDAAHGIHPIAGQGLNLGLRDAIALAGLVAEAVAAGADPGAPALLARYQAARRPDDLLMLAATDALDRLLSTDNAAVRLVRDLGIAAVHRMGPLKRTLARRASGL